MPTYDYRCKECEHVFELFHAPTARPRTACPSCGSKKKERMLGSGAGVIFKGSGFYETDYKKKSGSSTPPKDSGSGGGACGTGACPKSDS